MLDLEKVGLSEYGEYLSQKDALAGPGNFNNDSLKHLLKDLFLTCDTDKDGLITIIDAQRIVLHLNNRFGVSYNEKDVVEFFSRIPTNNRVGFNFEEFSEAFDCFYSL